MASKSRIKPELSLSTAPLVGSRVLSLEFAGLLLGMLLELETATGALVGISTGVVLRRH